MSTLRERSRTPVGRPPRQPRRTPRPGGGRRGPAGPLPPLQRWLLRLRDLLERAAKPRWRRLALTMEDQLHSQWCWAACSASVSSFYDAGSSWTQCRVANAELGQSRCCEDGAGARCNQPWYLQRALTRTGNLASWSSRTVPLTTIRSQIDAGRPVGARIGWAGGGGHFVMISGCLDAATGLLEVRDPIYGTSEISIASFASNYQGSGSWTHTYYTEA